MTDDSKSMTVESFPGDLQVVVFLPSIDGQRGFSFRPQNHADGLRSVPRRDLAILRAMLQDALDDVDDERHRRLRDEAAAAHGLPPQVVAPRPAPGHGPGTW